MTTERKIAIEAATQITIAAVQTLERQSGADCGSDAAEYFEAVFKKIYALAQPTL